MKLTRRLQAIYEMIPDDCIVADIGCDHAYLSCAAVLRGKCNKSYAMDNKPMPLNSAKQTINQYHLEDKVFPILSDGLEYIPEDADTLVIAGMGFETMKMILSLKPLTQFKTLILQPNNDTDMCRRWLNEIGFRLKDERIVHEGHFYTILVFEPGIEELNDDEILFGKYCHEQKEFYDFWSFRLNTLKSILAQMQDSDTKKEIEILYSRIQKKLGAQ